jgi:pimeloyl-ACP methyl ester carboxylesterase
MPKDVQRIGFFESNFNTGEITLNYVVGPENGLPVVLIPGQTATWQNYEPVFGDLSKSFQVYSLSIRGHGNSSWTTGNYTFSSIGKDLTVFLEKVVKRPAILVGNSSGGLISLWLGANKPELVKGVVLEDAPLFSADWPRIKREFVYEVLSSIAMYLGKKGGPDYEGFFNSIQRPLPNGKTGSLPKWLSKVLAWVADSRESLAGKISMSLLPQRLKTYISVLYTFDPDFSRAWVDGRIYEGLNHEDALRKIKVPLLILHADWFRTEKGLVGAMDDDDAKKAMTLAPHARYLRMRAQHAIHSDKPEEFVRIINEFRQTIN